MAYIGQQPPKVALTASDITDGIISSAKIADGTIATADIADSAVTAVKTSGVGGDNDPILSIGLNSAQNMSDNTWTTIVFDTEILDAGGIYNTSTGVCTPTAGTYLMIFAANVGGDTNSSLQNAGVKFNIGGTVTAEQTMNAASNNHRYTNLVTSYVHAFDGSTYVTCQAYNDVSSGQASVYGASSPRFGATFQMFKLIT